MLPHKAPAFWRYHILLVLVSGAILAAVAYYSGIVLLVTVQTRGLVHSALASERIDIRASELSEWRKCALVTVQDPGFYGNPGVGYSFRAAFTGTTITQTVVRKLYFADYKSGIGRINRTMIACYVLEHFASKDDQITLFINAAFFARSPEGESIVGFADAAIAYFNKPFAQLSEDEYLSLVAMLIDPERFNPRTHPRESAERKANIRGLVIDSCGRESGDKAVHGVSIPDWRATATRLEVSLPHAYNKHS
jgi:membrane peptidoglycan carboxypeptidase